ncbi:hypothetical protein [Paenibacillus polymyxa]
MLHLHTWRIWFGLIIVEGTYTDELFSQCYFNQPGMATDEQAKSWEKVVEAVHKAGGAIIVQLEHASALSQGNRFESNILAPSAVQPQGGNLRFMAVKELFRCLWKQRRKILKT